MSVIAKCFLVVLAVLCCLQLAEMAPRPDPPTNNGINVEDLSKQFNDFTQNLMEGLKKLSQNEQLQGVITSVKEIPENEQLKNFGKSVEGVFQEGFNKLSAGANELTSKIRQN